MAHNDDPEQQSGAAADRNNPGALPLEERVGRLELEIAALRQQIAAGGVMPRTVSNVGAAPPPPPPPVPPAKNFAPTATAEVRPVAADLIQAARREPVADSLDSFENRLGSQIFNRIAIVLLLVGTAYGMKLAVDRGLLGPAPRVILGLLAGTGLVVWSERFRRKGFAVFSYSLKAVGSGVLYLSLWAAFQRFQLLTAGVALALMVLVTAWNAYMAWVQDSELLAAYALAGGFATPLLVSTGGNHEVFLFTYLLAIDVATVSLVRLKNWPRLLLGAFPVTVVFFIGWYLEYFAADELAITSVFIVLFGLTFGGVPVGRIVAGAATAGRRVASLGTVLEEILLPLANAAFIALALYFVLQDSRHHALLPWLMLALAAVYLCVMRAPQTRTAAAIHLSLAVVFLTIAIPLKASGAWITASWLVEGLALLWVAARLAPAEAAQDSEADLAAAQASWALRPLAVGSLLLGFGGVCVHTIWLADQPGLALWNRGTGSALVGIAVFAAAAWIALRSGLAAKGGEAESNWERIAICGFVLIDLTAALLTIRELLVSWEWTAAHAPFQNVDFVTALIGLAVFAGVIAVSLRLAEERPGESFWRNCAGASTIAFNLIAVLTGVREIAAIWAGSAMTADEGLQQALAISAYLMLYGAVLLAVGFWKRSGFLRWQALVLLVFSIFKTFLYDMRNLSQGYRVVSILGLGSLLMAISFAYQKDWLHLREQESGAARGADSEGGQ
jgi:uncharacterized membrane protein